MTDTPRPAAAPTRVSRLRAGLRRAVLPTLLVSLWAGWLFRGPLFRDETLFVRDSLTYDRPLLALQARLWHETAGLPEWNPYLAEGQPFADRPVTSPFHPFAWALAILPFDAACTAQLILPPLAALLAMFILLRTLGRSRAASLYGACAWGLGGFVLSLADLLPMARTVAFIPALLAFLLRSVRSGRWADALGLAAAVALTAAGGEPTALLAAVVLGAATLAVALTERHDGGPRAPLAARLAPTAAGALLGVIMAAAVLVPAAHLAGMTVRAAPLEASDVDAWSLAPPRLLEPLVPYVLGDVDLARQPVYWGHRWYGDKAFPYVFSLYAGLLTPLLALLALAQPPRRVVPWATAGLIGALAALGGHTGTWSVLREVAPPLSSLRYPEKWALVPMMVIVILAAMGFDRLLEGTARFRRRALVALAAAVIVFAGGAAAIAAVTSTRGAVAWERVGVPPDLTAAFAGAMPRHLLRQAAVAGACFLAVLGLSRRRGLLAGALLAVTAVDLATITAPLLPTIPSADADRVPRFLAPLASLPRPPRLFHQAAWQPACARRADVAEPLAPARWGIPLAFEVDFDLTQLRWTHEATDQFLALTAREPRLAWPLLARRGVGEVARCTAAPIDWESQGAGPPVTLVAVPGDRGMVACLDRVERSRGVRGWAREVARLGDAAAGAAVVDVSDAGVLPDRPSPCRAVIVVRQPRHLVVDVDAAGPRPSLLAVNQTWHPGWSARLDGRDARLLRTDVSLQAVLVPRGRHTLELAFRDPWVERSALISAGACLVWLGALVGALARRRQG